MKIIIDILKVLCGFVIGFIFTIMILPTPVDRQRDKYRRGVEDGMQGKFKITVDSVQYHLEPIK